MQITVSISDFKTSKTPGDVLVTYSLGSCIGVAVADPAAQVAGLLHFQLPDSKMDPARAVREPAMFADTGLDAMIAALEADGASRRRMRVKLAGGAKMLAGSDTFDIGRRNHTAIRKALWKHGLMVDSEDCGGNTPRTMYVNVADGRVMLKRKQDRPAEAAASTGAMIRPVSRPSLTDRQPRTFIHPKAPDAASPMRIGA